MDRLKITLCGFDVEWDLDKGVNLWAGVPTLSMWISTTVAGLMLGMQKMVGTERFLLCMQQGGIQSVDGDWSIISSKPTLEEGMRAMNDIASTSGWGRWELLSVDRDKQEARFRTVGSWEGIYQKALGVCWGSAMMAGKFSGICERLFGTPCWAEQTVFYAQGAEVDEFVVRPSDVTIEQRQERLLAEGGATHADLAVALTKLRAEIAGRQRTEEDLRRSLELVSRQEEALRLLTSPIIQVWDGVLTVPIMGTLDSARATAMQDRLLQEILATRSRYALIDLTAVDVMDTHTADHLMRIIRAVELIGASALITGIRAAVAQTMVSLGVDLSHIGTLRDLKDGIKYCIRQSQTKQPIRTDNP